MVATVQRHSRGLISHGKTEGGHFRVEAERPTVQGAGGVVGGAVESVQHLLTPGGEAVLRLHALQQLQQLLLLLRPLPAHHVLLAEGDATGYNTKRRDSNPPFRPATYFREGLLRLFFRPRLLLFPRRLAWFFKASSHKPMLLDEPPLPLLDSSAPHMPTPSAHCPPMEELPMDRPECCGQKGA